MNIRNIIELILFIATIATLLPLYFMKRKKVKDLDGFDIAKKEECQEEDNIIIIE